MSYSSPSVNRRSVSSVIASAVVGVALGVVSVIGVASFSGQDTVPQGNAVPAEDALLGGPEYGTRG
ncbi:DUF2613 domain-containing protein [Corynebacterium sp. YIM 101645]|uniref:DUF2613 domain-containing protein n=1 Tax=Corynebacterium lemuris TaxID=1859292 RepID=A0ABT2FZV4_9CORY|nr:DUF2613 domain-containing protein [Corynebacterium lemuris]MCS5480549.1 DUF2613 domain-containing protein [Corynebacterium lemuris]